MTQDELIAALRRDDDALFVKQGLYKAAADEIERLREIERKYNAINVNAREQKKKPLAVSD